MATITFSNLGLHSIAACVPKNEIDNTTISTLLTPDEIDKATKTTGIFRRRFADESICASDLCFHAAQALIDHHPGLVNDIDLVIFLSQTPDFRQPATAPTLQHRLGLPKTTAAFDINLACSGYIYGLTTAFSYLQNPAINKVLLLVGETLSKPLSMEDRATQLLFGDAGTATVLEKGDQYGSSWFSLHSDGSGVSVLNIPAGGYRNPSSQETLAMQVREDGGRRSDEHIYMDGMEVFNFTMREVPKDIKELLAYSGKTIEEADAVLFHQANKFMTDFFAKKLKIPMDKVLYNLDRFGNTSAASIPLLITTEVPRLRTSGDVNLLASGFGAGLSWGSAWLKFNQMATILPLIEV